MKTSKKMQEVITALAERYEVDLAQLGAHLRLEMSGYERLVVRRFEENLVSVSHYYESHGDLVPDPQIVFFTGYNEWIPVEIIQDLGGHRVYVELSADKQDIVRVNEPRQAGLADFAEMWAQNIEDQEWLERGEKWDPCDPSNYPTPDVETLRRWEAQGGCQAVDGCWVESDGTCPHGCQSWLLVLGLI